MKSSVALLCLALGVCAHAFTVPVDEVTTTPTLPPIEPVPTETSPPVDDSTTTPPAPVVDDSTTTPPAPVVDDSTTTPPAPVVDDTTTTPPATVNDTTTTPPAPVVDTTTPPPTPVVDDTTTTTIPPPPYQCYDCNSGMHVNGGWSNDDCPVNGNINPASAKVLCSGSCVTWGGPYPAGTMTRGCNSSYWFPPNFDNSPGCRKLDNNIWCFSLGSLSNVQDMTEVSNFYIDQFNKAQSTPTP